MACDKVQLKAYHKAKAEIISARFPEKDVHANWFEAGNIIGCMLADEIISTCKSCIPKKKTLVVLYRNTITLT